MKHQITRVKWLLAFVLIAVVVLSLSGQSTDATSAVDFCSNCEQSAYEDTWGTDEDSYYNTCRSGGNSVSYCTRAAAQFYNGRIALCNYAGCEIPYSRVPNDN